jgi:hypothetical protein
MVISSRFHRDCISNESGVHQVEQEIMQGIKNYGTIGAEEILSQEQKHMACSM